MTVNRTLPEKRSHRWRRRMEASSRFQILRMAESTTPFDIPILMLGVDKTRCGDTGTPSRPPLLLSWLFYGSFWFIDGLDRVFRLTCLGGATHPRNFFKHTWYVGLALRQELRLGLYYFASLIVRSWNRLFSNYVIPPTERALKCYSPSRGVFQCSRLPREAAAEYFEWYTGSSCIHFVVQEKLYDANYLV